MKKQEIKLTLLKNELEGQKLKIPFYISGKASGIVSKQAIDEVIGLLSNAEIALRLYKISKNPILLTDIEAAINKSQKILEVNAHSVREQLN